jgi:hypothetical protein
MLQCLETCVKNCGRRFHNNVANKDFLQELVKIIGPKYDPPLAVQEKVLSMIQVRQVFQQVCIFNSFILHFKQLSCKNGLSP